MNSVTITGITGPGSAVTAQLIQNVQNFSVDYLAQTIRIQTSTGIQYFQLVGITSIVDTISGGLHSWVIS